MQSKLHVRMNEEIFKVVEMSYGIKNPATKNIYCRTSPEQQFKKFPLTEQKTRPKNDKELIWKSLLKMRSKT